MPSADPAGGAQGFAHPRASPLAPSVSRAGLARRGSATRSTGMSVPSSTANGWPAFFEVTSAVYAGWLNSLTGPVQILARTGRPGLSNAVAGLEGSAAGLPRPALEAAVLDHAAWLAGLAGEAIGECGRERRAQRVAAAGLLPLSMARRTCLEGCAGGADLVSAAGQDAAGQLLQAGFVFDEQDRLAAAAGSRGLRSRSPGGFLAGGGQQAGDGGADPGLGVDLGVAAGSGDDAVERGEAEAGALALRLGGEERLEHPGDYVGGHAGAGVGDPQPGVAAGRQAG